MASDYRILSGGSTYYLVNSSRGYATAGGSATGVSTTPYGIVDDWTPTAAPRQESYAGGAPFTIGSPLLNAGYNNVTESLKVLVVGSSHDNLVSLIQQLYQILNTALYTAPAVLYVDPDGGTSAVYYEIYGADVQPTTENHLLIAEGSSSVICRVTWRRSPFGGRLTTPQTVINAASSQNQSSGAPDNVDAYSTGSGDLINEGGPCNYSITPTNTAGGDYIFRVLLASIASRTYSTGPGGALSTSGTTFDTGASSGSMTVDLASMIGNRRLKLRLIAVLSAAPSSNAEVRFRITAGSAAAQGRDVIVTAPQPYVDDAGYIQRVVDSGPIPISIDNWRTLSDAQFRARLQIRSTDGSSATATVTAIEAVLYYDWCEIRMGGTPLQWANGAGTLWKLTVSSFAERSSVVCLPLARSAAFLSDPATSEQIVEFAQVRGTVPRYYPSASLWALLLNTTSSTPGGTIYRNTAQTYTITATHAPLYRTLRGAG